MTTHHHEETTTMRVLPSPDATTPTDRTPEQVRARHRRTDPACIEHDGNTPVASRGMCCRVCDPEPTPEPATGATVDALEFNRFLAERLKDPAVRAAYVQSKTRTDSDYDIARHALSDLRTDAGFVLGDVIARLVLDSGAVVATARADAGWAKVKTLAEDFVREFERAEDAEDALARVSREAEALRAKVAAVEALADKRDVPYPPKWVFGAEENYCNGYRAMRDTLRGILATTGEGKCSNCRQPLTSEPCSQPDGKGGKVTGHWIAGGPYATGEGK